MTTLEDRVRRREDVEAIRALDARYCGLIDTGDWPGLVATGRRPRTAGLGLEKAGVATDECGFVAVDAHQRTGNPASSPPTM